MAAPAVSTAFQEVTSTAPLLLLDSFELPRIVPAGPAPPPRIAPSCRRAAHTTPSCRHPRPCSSQAPRREWRAAAGVAKLLVNFELFRDSTRSPMLRVTAQDMDDPQRRDEHITIPVLDGTRGAASGSR